MGDLPAAESVLVAALKAAFPDVRIATETPANLGDVLPCIVVARFGGAEDSEAGTWAFDNANMDFDCYDADRIDARALAESVRTFVRRDLPGQSHAGAFVARTQTIMAPVWTPYDNTDVRRFTYAASIRLHATGIQ